MKIIEKWNEVDRRQAGAGMQVLYELGGYRIAVSDASYMPGGLSITAYPINRDSYSPEIYVGGKLRRSRPADHRPDYLLGRSAGVRDRQGHRGVYGGSNGGP